MRNTLIIMLIVAVAVPTALQAGGRGRCRQQARCATETAASVDLTESETTTLHHMRLEEKLARDVYLTLGEIHDSPVFVNIPRAEGRHMSSVAGLLDRYGLEDPVTDDTVGVFPDPAFAALYDDLVAQGRRSRTAAFTVGATIEDLDLKDLYEAIEGTDNEDLARVYENLARGSRNHLRAFAAQLAGLDETYEAQHLTQDQIDEILAGDHERGGRGRGKGRGGRGAGCGRG